MFVANLCFTIKLHCKISLQFSDLNMEEEKKILVSFTLFFINNLHQYMKTLLTNEIPWNNFIYVHITQC